HEAMPPSKVHDTTTGTHPPTHNTTSHAGRHTTMHNQQTTNKKQKVHWHTIEFSHNTPQPNHNREK
ncbi:hypothetical protein, partial [Corynebacterium qintianiae]|uniref:hypothetical protein n=1 Tax=Corynebacterium qintianiae TaxID=2709392 RepID=UPI00197DFBCD